MSQTIDEFRLGIGDEGMPYCRRCTGAGAVSANYNQWECTCGARYSTWHAKDEEIARLRKLVEKAYGEGYGDGHHDSRGAEQLWAESESKKALGDV
jgi:hypothetical protein